MLLVAFLILIGLSLGVLLILSKRKISQLSPSPLPLNLPSMKPKITSDARVKDLPIYPGAILVGTENLPRCADVTEEDRVVFCDGIKYKWHTSTPLDELIDWYENDRGNTGWILNGGAGAADIERFGNLIKGTTQYWIYLSNGGTNEQTYSYIEISLPPIYSPIPSYKPSAQTIIDPEYFSPSI